MNGNIPKKNPFFDIKTKGLKKKLIILILSLSVASVFAQKHTLLNEPTHDDRPIHFGFCLGLNVMDFIVHTSANSPLNDSLMADVSVPVPGFHIQIITNYRLNDYFDVRFLPGISFGQRDVNFFKKDKLVSDKHKLESNYLEFPILLKYKAKRLDNFRPYMITGLNCRVDLAKTYSEDDGIYLDLGLFDVFYEIGAGIDFYLPYFKLSTELKFSYGFLNDLKKKNTKEPKFQNSIEKLNSTLVMLSFHFE
jgi:hypothetical protein